MRYQCDPESSRCWLQQHVARLGVFDDCFPGRIGLTDVDGMVERNGCMLVVELKSPGVPLPTGQRIAFERLSARLGRAYFPMVIWGAPDFAGPLECETWVAGRSRGRRAVSLDGLRAGMRRWFAWANRQAMPMHPE